MSAYLFDTDTCVFRLCRMFEIDRQIAQVSKRNRYVSEITIAELRFGAERVSSARNKCFSSMQCTMN